MSIKGKTIHLFSKKSIHDIISSDVFKLLHPTICINPLNDLLIRDDSLIVINKNMLKNIDFVKLRDDFPNSTILICSCLNILPLHIHKMLDITIFYMYDPIFINPIVYERLTYFIPKCIAEHIQGVSGELYGYDGCEIIRIS